MTVVTSPTACLTAELTCAPYPLFEGWMPSTATSQPSSSLRYAASMERGMLCVEAVIPSISSSSIQRTVPGASPISAASTSSTVCGWKRRRIPVTFSGACPASTTSMWLRASNSAWRESSRATRLPAASSPRCSFPTPTIASPVRFPSSALRGCSSRCSETFQELLNVVVASIIDRKLLLQDRVLPVLVGHAHALELAARHALPAVDAAVHVVLEHKALGRPVERHQLDGFRRAVLRAQVAARAGLWVVVQHAAVALGRRQLLEGIQLRGGFLEEGLQDVLEHGADSHSGLPFRKMSTRICSSTRMVPKRHHKPTVWSMRRRVSSVCRMLMSTSTASVF